MMTPKECLEQAELCWKMAEKAKSVEAKERFTWVAEAWAKLAKSYEQGANQRIIHAELYKGIGDRDDDE